MRATQIQVRVGTGHVWRLSPEVDRVRNALGPGEALRVSVEISQADLRSRQQPEQTTALRAVVAMCLLAVLPDDHPGRPALDEAVSVGVDLLPPPG